MEAVLEDQSFLFYLNWWLKSWNCCICWSPNAWRLKSLRTAKSKHIFWTCSCTCCRDAEAAPSLMKTGSKLYFICTGAKYDFRGTGLCWSPGKGSSSGKTSQMRAERLIQDWPKDFRTGFHDHTFILNVSLRHQTTALKHRSPGANGEYESWLPDRFGVGKSTVVAEKSAAMFGCTRDLTNIA